MTFCLVPNNDIQPFDCNNTFWSELLCKTPVGQHIGVSSRKGGGFWYEPDSNDLSPLVNGGADEKGNDCHFEVRQSQATLMSETAQELLNKPGVDDVNNSLLKEFVAFSKNSAGFIIC